MSVIVSGSLVLLALFVSALVWRTRAKADVPAVRAAQSAPPPQQERISVLGRGILVEGMIRCGDPLRIDGVFRGDINATAPLTIGETGLMTGDVHARELFVAGELQGDIDADRLGLRATARVTGDIGCTAISVENGAWFLGRVAMKRGEAAAETRATTA